MANWQPPGDESPIYPTSPADNPYAAGAPGYPTPGYPTPGYPTPGYPTPGYPTPGYPTPGYSTSGYPTPGYSTSGYPAPGAPHGYPYAAPGGYGVPGYRPGPPPRPGSLTAAAVLGYVNAGLVIFAGLLLFTGASWIADADDAFGTHHNRWTAELTIDGFLNLIAAGLLIAGGVTMAGRRSSGRTLYSVGGALMIALTIYWLTRWTGPLDAAGIVFYALVYAAIAIVGLSLAWTGAGTRWLRAAQPANAGSLNR